MYSNMGINAGGLNNKVVLHTDEVFMRIVDLLTPVFHVMNKITQFREASSFRVNFIKKLKN